MDPVQKKKTGRDLPKRGKANRISRTEELLRRQRKFRLESRFLDPDVCLGDKTWLETHIWHAKRMHMENMWGHRLVRANYALATLS
jgi:ribonuclease P/MRP protein subunit POP1